MGKLGRHVIHKMLNGENIELNKNELQFFDKDFIEQYNLIESIKGHGVEVNKQNLELMAAMENKIISSDYGKQEETYNTLGTMDLITLNISKERNIREKEKLSPLLYDFTRLNNREAGSKLYSLLGQQLNNQGSSKVVSPSDYYKTQQEYITRVYNKEELDGVFLYGNGRKATRQFIKLSYQLKKIGLSDLVVIGARPSVGKSGFGLTLMNALYKNGYKPLLVSLEMTNEENIERLTLAKAGISNNSINDPTDKYENGKPIQTGITEGQYMAYQTALQQVCAMDIKMVNEPPRSWLEIKQHILDHQHEIDYVLIDHLHNIPSYDGTLQPNENLLYTQITRDAKQLALTIKKPIIFLAQLNREVSGGKSKNRFDAKYVEPYSTDLRSSGSIEQDANIVLFLYRKPPEKGGGFNEQFIASQEARGQYRIILKVEKNRNGASGGKIEYNFDAPTGRWKELGKDEWYTKIKPIN